MKPILFVLVALITSCAAPAIARASHTDNFVHNQPDGMLNTPGSPLTGFIVKEHNNVGATDEADEPNFCQGKAGRFDYGATVWYDFQPHRDGRVAITVSSPGGQFTPVANLQPYTPPRNFDFANSSCEVASGLSGVATPTPVDVRAGETWKVQIGGTSPSGSQGAYRLDFSFDPDSDGDGVLDSADACDARPGPAATGGCPPDRDRDGIPDGRDRCATQDARGRDRNKDGCLDVVLLHSFADSKLSFDQFRGGIEVKRLSLTGVPRGARVRVACLGPRRGGRRRSCGGQVVRSASSAASVRAHTAKTLVLRRFRGKRLRAGSTLTIQITATRATGKYIRYTVTRRGVGATRIDRCTNPGSRKLRRRGCR